jgi:carbonic anhydrase/acetyltransferase-like protein (isoleucine patch superfamily)
VGVHRAIRALVPLLILGFAPLSGAQDDSLLVPKGTVRAGDIVVLGKEIFLEGELIGSAVLVGGSSASVSGRIHRDLIVLGSRATIKRGAVIDGDVLAIGGSLTFEETPGGLSPDSASARSSPQVRGRIRTITALEAAVVSELETSPLTSGKTSPLVLSFRLFLLFSWLVVSIGLLFLAPRPVLRAADEARGRLGFLAALGATAVLTAVLLAAFALSILPARFALVFCVALLLALAAAKIFGLAALFVVLGRRATRGAVRGGLLFGDPAALALGLLLLGLVSLVPLAGPLVWGLASLAGIGVSLAAAASRETRLVLAAS